MGCSRPPICKSTYVTPTCSGITVRPNQWPLCLGFRTAPFQKQKGPGLSLRGVSCCGSTAFKTAHW
jgi:hypothetical protein